MRLPIKISPDNIKDSFVEVKYLSSLPFEVLVGYFYNALSENYFYTNQPKQSKKQNQLIANIPHEITFNLGGLNFFYSDKLKIQIQQNSIIFNCTDTYIGWNEYKEEMQNALTKIFTIKEIEVFNRVGIRYISEYSEVDIKDVTKFEFTFGIPQIKSNTFVFRTEFDWDEFRIIVSLQHKSPVLNAIDRKNMELQQISVIDIDIITEGLEIKNATDLLKKIEVTHSKEKEVFFSILKEEFIQTLNPVY